MKIRVALILACLFTCTLFLTGCMGEDTGLTLGSAWDETQTKTYVYTLSHTAGESTCGYNFNLTEGTFTTALTTLTDEASGEKRYVYETVLRVSGAYTKGEESFPFSDVTTTRTEMHGITSYSLFPISSERNIYQHSVYPKQDNSGFTVYEHNYRVTTAYNYNKKNATVTFLGYNAETGAYDLPVENVPETRTYAKISAGTFFDNDAMTFAFRSFPLAVGFNTTYSTLDTVSARKVNIYLAAAGEITQRGYTINGENTSLDVLKLTATVNAGASSGKPFTMYYAPMEGKTERNILTELTTTLPYGMGTLTYALSGM